MPMKSIDVKIGENNFNITTFGFCKGIEIQAKLIKLVSPFGYLFSGKSKDSKFSNDNDQEIKSFGILDQEITESAIHLFIEKICEKLDDKLIDFLLELCSTTLVDNKTMTRQQIDIVFAGNYLSMYELIYEIIKVNNFLPEGTIGKILLQGRKMVPKNME